MSYINKEQAIDLIESMIADKGVAFNPHKLAMALKDMESVEIVHCKDCEFWTPESEVTGKLESVEKATSEGEEMRLNLNETVKVKLTERGKELYREYFSPLPDGFEQPEPRIDEDGFTEIQLWVFMAMFGKSMSIGKPNVIKPLEIVFNTEDSESVKEQEIKLDTDLISRQAAIEAGDSK